MTKAKIWTIEELKTFVKKEGKEKIGWVALTNDVKKACERTLITLHDTSTHVQAKFFPRKNESGYSKVFFYEQRTFKS